MPEVSCRAEVLAYIALGANLGDAQSQVRQAIHNIAQLPDTRLVGTSSLYRTAPFEARGPDYINAVIVILTRLDGHELLLRLQHLEVAQGRERSFRNAPRTLDLDILLYGNATINTPTLQVPHPRMFERAFVLVPLAEIAPDWVTAAQLTAVSTQEIVRLGS
jgi:2-amino-4-hydroxy-6-hydroxymethyldihydropteridine diphosphokinase